MRWTNRRTLRLRLTAALVIISLLASTACSSKPPVVPVPTTAPATPTATPEPASPNVVLSIGAGTVEHLPAKGADWGKATDGQPIGEGASIRTSADGRAGITFLDGSVIVLQPSTEVQFDFLDLEKRGADVAKRLGRVTLVKGDIAFDIAKAPYPPSVFEIGTASELVVIKGTKGFLGVRGIASEGVAIDPTRDQAGEGQQMNVEFALPERSVDSDRSSPVVVSSNWMFELALLDGSVGVAQIAVADDSDAPQLRIVEVDAGASLSLPTRNTPADQGERATVGAGATSGPAQNQLFDAARLVFLGGDKAMEQVRNTGDVNAGVQTALQDLAATPASRQAFQTMLDAGYFQTMQPPDGRRGQPAAGPGAQLPPAGPASGGYPGPGASSAPGGYPGPGSIESPGKGPIGGPGAGPQPPNAKPPRPGDPGAAGFSFDFSLGPNAGNLQVLAFRTKDLAPNAPGGPAGDPNGPSGPPPPGQGPGIGQPFSGPPAFGAGGQPGPNGAPPFPPGFDPRQFVGDGYKMAQNFMGRQPNGPPGSPPPGGPQAGGPPPGFPPPGGFPGANPAGDAPGAGTPDDILKLFNQMSGSARRQMPGGPPPGGITGGPPQGGFQGGPPPDGRPGDPPAGGFPGGPPPGGVPGGPPQDGKPGGPPPGGFAGGPPPDVKPGGPPPDGFPGGPPPAGVPGGPLQDGKPGGPPPGGFAGGVPPDAKPGGPPPGGFPGGPPPGGVPGGPPQDGKPGGPPPGGAPGGPPPGGGPGGPPPGGMPGGPPPDGAPGGPPPGGMPGGPPPGGQPPGPPPGGAPKTK